MKKLLLVLLVFGLVAGGAVAVFGDLDVYRKAVGTSGGLYISWTDIAPIGTDNISVDGKGWLERDTMATGSSSMWVHDKVRFSDEAPQFGFGSSTVVDVSSYQDDNYDYNKLDLTLASYDPSAPKKLNFNRTANWSVDTLDTSYSGKFGDSSAYDAPGALFYHLEVNSFNGHASGSDTLNDKWNKFSGGYSQD